MKKKLVLIASATCLIYLISVNFTLLFPPTGTIEKLLDNEEFFAYFTAENIKEVLYPDGKSITADGEIDEIIGKILNITAQKLDEDADIYVSEKSLRFYTDSPHDVSEYCIYIDEEDSRFCSIIAFYTGKGENEHGKAYVSFKTEQEINLHSINE